MNFVQNVLHSGGKLQHPSMMEEVGSTTKQALGMGIARWFPECFVLSLSMISRVRLNYAKTAVLGK